MGCLSAHLPAQPDGRLGEVLAFLLKVLLLFVEEALRGRQQLLLRPELRVVEEGGVLVVARDGMGRERQQALLDEGLLLLNDGAVPLDLPAQTRHLAVVLLVRLARSRAVCRRAGPTRCQPITHHKDIKITNHTSQGHQDNQPHITRTSR